MPLNCSCWEPPTRPARTRRTGWSQDASRITAEGEPQNWDAVELAVLPRAQTAIIVGRQRPHLEGRRQPVAALPRQDQDQHHRLPELMAARPPDCPQIAERPPILKLRRCRLSQWASSIGLAAAGDLLLGASCHGCGQPWWGICPTLSSAARRPTSLLHQAQFPAPTDSR